jgi:hypothetical protein
MMFDISRQQRKGDAVVRVLVAFLVGFSVFALMMACLLVIWPQPIPAFFCALAAGLAVAVRFFLVFRAHWRRLRLDDNAIVLEDGFRSREIEYREVDVVVIGGLEDSMRYGTPLRIRRGWREFRIWLDKNDLDTCLAALRVRCSHAAIIPEIGPSVPPKDNAARPQAQRRLTSYRRHQTLRLLTAILIPWAWVPVGVFLSTRDGHFTRRDIIGILAGVCVLAILSIGRWWAQRLRN